MRGAEGVVDIEIGELAKLPGEVLVVGFFFGVEAEVFEQQGLAFFQLARHFFGFGADALGTEADVLAARQFLVEHHAQTFGDGLEAHLGIRLAFGTAEVRGENEARAVAQSVLDGGQGFADAGVVHDAAVVERDVEIHAHEDAAVVEREIENGKLGHECSCRCVGRYSLIAVGEPVVWPVT